VLLPSPSMLPRPRLLSSLVAGLALAVTAVPCAAQFWWPQPRPPAPAPWQPELFSDYLASGQPPHPAVPRIIAAERAATSLGSGVLVDVNDRQGLVVTNWHVVRDTSSAVLVQFPDGFQTAGTVLLHDETWDLAVIVIWRPPVAPIPLADGLPAIGAPLSIAGWGRGTFRAQTGPCTQYLSPGSGHPQELVEMLASARQGDSGGPILDAGGRLVGILFGQNEGRTIGSGVARVRMILARVGSSGAMPDPPLIPAAAPMAMASLSIGGERETAATAASFPAAPDGTVAAAPSDAVGVTPGPVPPLAPPVGQPTVPTGSPFSPTPPLPSVTALVDRLGTAAGRDTALRGAGGLALAILGLRALFGGRRAS